MLSVLHFCFGSGLRVSAGRGQGDSWTEGMFFSEAAFQAPCSFAGVSLESENHPLVEGKNRSCWATPFGASVFVFGGSSQREWLSFWIFQVPLCCFLTELDRGRSLVLGF